MRGGSTQADYVTGACAGGNFSGYRYGDQMRAGGLCEAGAAITGTLEDGTPWSGICRDD